MSIDPKVLAVEVEGFIFPANENVVPPNDEVDEPSPCNPRNVAVVPPPLKEIAIPVSIAEFRAEIFKAKSVNVFGILEKSIVEAPPAPTVLDAISSKVFAIMPPLSK